MREARPRALATATLLAILLPAAVLADERTPSRREAIPTVTLGGDDLFAGVEQLTAAAPAQLETPRFIPEPLVDALAAVSTQQPEPSEPAPDVRPARSTQPPLTVPFPAQGEVPADYHQPNSSNRFPSELPFPTVFASGPDFPADYGRRSPPGAGIDTSAPETAGSLADQQPFAPASVTTYIDSTATVNLGLTSPTEEGLPGRALDPAGSAAAPRELPGPPGHWADPPFVAEGAPPKVALRRLLGEVPVPPVDPPPGGDPLYDDLSADIDYPDDAEDSSSQGWGGMGFWGGSCDAGLVAGVEGTFLAPLGEPQQSVVLTNLNNDRIFHGSAQPGLGCGVRTWLGLRRCGWGFRVGYWHFNDERIESGPVVPFEGQATFLQAFSLKARAVDIELAQGLYWGAWRLGASFGGRWARVERNSSVVGYGVLGESSSAVND